MASELVNAAADGNYTHVPYKGGAPPILNQKVAQIAEPEFRRRLSELGGVSPASGNTVDAVNEVMQRELAVMPKKALELGLKMD